MKTKIPSPVLKNSEVVTVGNLKDQVTNKVVVYADTLPDSVPEGLVENGLVIVRTNTGATENETYPDATGATKGVVRVDKNININDGVISVNDASTTVKGVVQLSNSTTSTSDQTAATSKALFDVAQVKSVIRTSTKPAQVPSNLAPDGIVIVDMEDGRSEGQVYPNATGASKGIVQVGNNLKVDNGVVSVETGSTSTRGVVQLSDSVNSENSNVAATSKAVKSAYDLANDAKNSKYVVYASSVPSSVPSGLVNGGLVIVN